MQVFSIRAWASVYAVLICCPVAWGVDYARDIRPLLREKCWSCHGVLKQESDLRLDARTSMVTAGVVVPGDPDASELLRRVLAEDDAQMPPRGEGTRVTAREYRLLHAWIAAGAEAPEEPVLASPTDHWAFQPIRRPSQRDPLLPDSLDGLIDRRLRHYNLAAQAQAPRTLLLRRLYLDLLGLPPTARQLRDPRPYEEIVDALLASPQYGVRWARHWMDIWRYSDGYGLNAQLRYSQHHLWHWRDWIVESLNADKGYDRMIVEMLAADEAAPEDLDAIRATGFLARNYYLFNRTTWLDNTLEHTAKAFLGLTLNCAKCHDHKYDPITQMDYYRMRAIFEPHQVRLDPVPGQSDLDVDGLPRVFDDHLDAPTYLHVRGDPLSPDKSRTIEPGVPALFAGFQPPIRSIALPHGAFAPAARPYVQQDLLAVAQARLAAARQAAKSVQKVERVTREDELENESASSPPGETSGGTVDGSAMAELRLRAAESHLAAVRAALQVERSVVDGGVTAETLSDMRREASRLQALAAVADAELALAELQEATQPDPKQVAAAEKRLASAGQALRDAELGKRPYQPLRVSRKALESPAHKQEDYPTVYPSQTTGRRLALAQWIVSSDNPLTARVCVNHVWMRHFGEPLVESVFDFGLRAPEPLHADVLDFLATELVESGWSLKHLHRLIVTSAAYRRSCSNLGADPRTLAFDPQNKYLWRMHVRRMESEVVRDSLLALAGKLDLALGGPSLSVGSDSHRRSLFYRHSRDDEHPFLSLFDHPDHLQCYRRERNIVPQQALAMVNADMVAECVTSMADGWIEEADSPAQFAQLAFFRLLGRPPTAEELQACEDFLRSDPAETNAAARAETPDGHGTARLAHAAFSPRNAMLLVHALVNHNDFITIR
ncbi:MAG: DUF1553 domain-containing protein [Planctomycetota bacterium]|nr:MAG: DUF1553 domain-containing protein [Planctomycetota bacterium]